jgi:hypothetical protein
MATSRGSVLDARDDTAGTPGEAGFVAAVALPAPGVGAEGDEPAAGGFGLGAGRAAGDGPPALGADAFRPPLRGHREATFVQVLNEYSRAIARG